MNALATVTPGLFYWVSWLNAIIWFSIFVIVLAKWTKPVFWPALQSHLQRRGLIYAYFGALLSTLGSLWLSELAGYPPCKLCWFQRICMYPLVIVTGVGLYTKKPVRLIGLILAWLGAIIAAYHYLLQRLSYIGSVFGWDLSVYAFRCGEGVDCSSMLLGYWGFYSIPLMALCGFAVVLVGLHFSKE